MAFLRCRWPALHQNERRDCDSVTFQLGRAAPPQPRADRISHGIVRGPCRVLLSFSNCVSANGFTGARASACELDRGQFRTGRDIVALGRCRRSRACLNHSASFRREALFARENRTRPFLFRTRASFEGSATADCRSSHSKHASAGPGSGFYSGVVGSPFAASRSFSTR